MSRIVYFRQRGRFTNNLFQYFAAEIIKKIFNYDKVILDTKIGVYDVTSVLRDSCYVIDDEKYVKIINQREVYDILNKNIYLDGYFQRSEIFLKMREYLLSLFSESNENCFRRFSPSCPEEQYKICDVVKALKNTINIPEKSSLTLHIRLDDFLGDLQIFNVHQTKELVQKVMKEYSLETLYIVCDKLRYNWEFEYMAHFLDLDPIMISNSLLEDFNFMMKSPYLFTSASTLSWMAGFLGEHQKVFIPYNTFHGGEKGYGQSLREFNDSCMIFDGMKYYII